MNNVFLVNFKSTGETWQTTVCRHDEAVQSTLLAYNLTELVYGSSNLYREYRDPKDHTQTAIVTNHKVCGKE